MPEFTRGFKSWAERTAISLRRDLGLEPHSPLSAAALAKHLDVVLTIPQEIQGLSEAHKRQLLEVDNSSWSAVTIYRGGNYVVIYNPTHSDGRRSSDIMHELSHVIIGHEPSETIVSADAEIVLRSYNQKQEDEAGWLSYSLLLPREALLHIGRLHIPEAEVYTQYQVSPELFAYRRNVTGVSRQIRKWPKHK